MKKYVNAECHSYHVGTCILCRPYYTAHEIIKRPRTKTLDYDTIRYDTVD